MHQLHHVQLLLSLITYTSTSFNEHDEGGTRYILYCDSRLRHISTVQHKIIQPQPTILTATGVYCAYLSSTECTGWFELVSSQKARAKSRKKIQVCWKILKHNNTPCNCQITWVATK